MMSSLLHSNLFSNELSTHLQLLSFQLCKVSIWVRYRYSSLIKAKLVFQLFRRCLPRKIKTPGWAFLSRFSLAMCEFSVLPKVFEIHMVPIAIWKLFPSNFSLDTSAIPGMKQSIIAQLVLTIGFRCRIIHKKWIIIVTCNNDCMITFISCGS